MKGKANMTDKERIEELETALRLASMCLMGICFALASPLDTHARQWIKARCASTIIEIDEVLGDE